MEEIRTVIRDQELKNTQFLEVMAKQQSEAQASAAAAMIAQNEALKSFQETISSVVVHTYSSGCTKLTKSDRPRKSQTPWQYVSPDMQWVLRHTGI